MRSFCDIAGDSGGPLIIPDTKSDHLKSGNPAFDQIVGIVSLGDNCEEKMDGASAYTQVNKFLPWIYEVLSIGICRLKVWVAL